MALLKFIKGVGLNGKSRVVVDPKSLMLAPLLDIWNNDQTETKDYANDLLCYIHIVSQLDPAAPFYKSSFDEVKFLAKSQIFRNMEHQFREEEEIFIQNALEVYLKDNEESEERMLQVYDKKIDEMRLELDAKKIEITKNIDPITGKVTYSTNAKMITDVMKEIGNILKIKDELEAQIENSRAKGQSRIKANREPSFLEKQLQKSQSDARAREAASAAASGTATDAEYGGQESSLHRQTQQPVQGDGSESQESEASRQRSLPEARKTNRRKYAKAERTSESDEEF